MKNKLTIFIILAILISALAFGGCSSRKDGYFGGIDNSLFNQNKGDEYLDIDENPVILTSAQATSNFSMYYNTAAYANIRRYINNNIALNKNMVNIENMVNYFKYSYQPPTNNEILALNGSIYPCPWNDDAYLLTLGLKAQEIEMSGKKNNLVFLLDVSGSMDSPNKMGLMQSAFSMIVQNLTENDTVSIVTYAGQDSVILEGANGTEQKRILNKIEDLSAGGSTAGARGIETAYEIAKRYFIDGQDANNRIILATDGDFNVGISSTNQLAEFIKQKAEQDNIYLTLLGFGYGNLKANIMETIAKNGNGSYHYIDTLTEARKVLIEEMGGTLVTVAKDVKAQVEFNPKYVYSYRLLGYENYLLTNDQWEDNKTDAGEIGSGHTVTAVYEIVLQDPDNDIQSTMDNNYLSLTIKYKDSNDISQADLKMYMDASDKILLPNEDEDFIASIVEAALIMRDSQYKGTADINRVINRLQFLACTKSDEYKAEFLDLMKKYKEQL